MIRVSVDMVPKGFENRKRNMYTLEITNLGGEGMTQDEQGQPLYSYKVRSIDAAGNKYEHGTMVTGFDRRQPVYKLMNIITEKMHEEGIFKNFK